MVDLMMWGKAERGSEKIGVLRQKGCDCGMGIKGWDKVDVSGKILWWNNNGVGWIKLRWGSEVVSRRIGWWTKKGVVGVIGCKYG